jgi:hypothetical protein
MRLHRLAVAAVSLGAVAATGLALAAPAEAVPQTGACYAYKIAVLEADSTTAPVVDCSADHTAETYLVGTLQDAFGLPSKAGQPAKLAAGDPCTVKAMNAYLGVPGRVLPSRFTTKVLFPTDEQWTAGERWFRCDVVLQGGLALKSFTGTAKDFVASAPETQFDFCTPGQPNAKATSAYPCLNPKVNWIKVLDEDLGGPGSKFPGTNTVEKKTRKLCGQQGKKWSGGEKYAGWWAIWPTQVGWGEGKRSAQCFVPYKQYLKELAKRAPKPAPSPSPSASTEPVPAEPAAADQSIS